jgi:hypothetical protein
MWVVCINNGVCDEASSASVNLTFGKQYYVTYVKFRNTISGPRDYSITNDIGLTIFYSSNRFVKVDEYREKQLMELLNL